MTVAADRRPRGRARRGAPAAAPTPWRRERAHRRRTAHPDRAAHIELEGYDGPLALLVGSSSSASWTSSRSAWVTSPAPTSRRSSRWTPTQMAHISAFVTVASQLILIKSRAHPAAPTARRRQHRGWPRPRGGAPRAAHRCTAATATRRVLRGRSSVGWQLFQREPSPRSPRPGQAPDPTRAPRSTRAPRRRRSTRRLRARAAAAAAPGHRPAPGDARGARAVIRAALADTPVLVLQELLGDLRGPGRRGASRSWPCWSSSRAASWSSSRRSRSVPSSAAARVDERDAPGARRARADRTPRRRSTSGSASAPTRPA